MVRSAPKLSALGVGAVVPWYMTQCRPVSEYHAVQQVAMHDLAGSARKQHAREKHQQHV